ncbi:MAG: SseB family protein [Ornithinimicrobium sp.]
MSERFEGHDPAQGQDTAGVPWQGRELTSTGFDADDGAADVSLLGALGAATASHPPHAESEPESPMVDEVGLLAAVSAARLIIPIVAVPGADAASDMAAVTLSAPDGRKALPAFTSIDQLAAWDGQARPVPVTAQRAALAAVQEGCDVMVLDVGTPHARELRTSMVWALAMGRDWWPAHRDEHVARAVGTAARGEQHIVRWSLGEGEAGALVIHVALVPGLTPRQINDVLQRVGAQIATDGEARARIDAVVFRLLDDTASH